MNEDKEKLQHLLDNILPENSYDTNLYIITRHLKPEVKHYTKVLDKYDFRVNKVDSDEELKSYFIKIIENQLSRALSKEDIEICQYSIIDDDLDNKIYTYALNNALSFADVITNQLSHNTDPRSINSLKEIKDDIWAYCLKIDLGNSVAFTFRKLSSGKVGTDDNNKSLIDKIRCSFDTNDARLEILKKETISFDDKIDCIYLENKFFVFKKGNFETLIGLEEELKENAEEMIQNLSQKDFIDGLSALTDEIENDKSLLKIFARIARNKKYKELDSTAIPKMQEISSKFKENLKIRDNKIIIEDKKDLRLFSRLLNDYYKKGEITGTYYGTNSGRILTVNE